MKRVPVVLAALLAATSLAQERRRGPPPEAIAACRDLQPDAACSFNHDGHVLAGTCHPGPEGRPAACRPAGAPERPPEQDDSPRR